ncbi:MAG: hypothetical protein HWN81_08980 [Candidatus Lokiarchaeota archaeon]|nr:hypothetical protein [Candidatus Lokiarchaeota archaeon]
MKLKISKNFQDFLIIHFVFAAICVLILLIPISGSNGIKLFILVVIYNIIIPLFAYFRNHSEWINIWLFVFILSLFQVWPDWFLSAELDILVFPEDGFIKIGTISLYMAGLWAIPLFLIIFIVSYLQENYSILRVYLVVAFLSLIIFGLAEQAIWMLESWYAQNVIMIGHLALYIIIPEIILGIITFYGYNLILDKNHLLKIPVAFTIMLLYLGSAVFFYFLIERVIFL